MAEPKKQPSPKRDEYYKLSTLNKWFAIANIVLVIIVVMIYKQDYARHWKDYQREFRNIEIRHASAALEGTQEALGGESRVQELKDKRAHAQKALDAKAKDVALAKEQLNQLEGRYYKENQKYQFAKAEYDEAKYQTEARLGRGDALSRSLQKRLAKTEEKMHAMLLAADETDQKVQAQKETLSQYSADLKAVEKELGALTREHDLIQRKLAKLDPNRMTFWNKVADKFRDQPIVDFMSPTIKIEQLVVKVDSEDVNFARVPRVDRCVTCHQGVTDEAFKEEDHPFQSHPNLDLFLSSQSPHPIEEFGCTTCHEGRGRGTDFSSTVHMPSSLEQKEAWQKEHHWHQLHHWENPMYPSKYVEAGCFKCHSNETAIPGAETLNFGLNVIEQAGCYGCHEIERYKDLPKRGPSLKHVAAKTHEDWLYRWIKDPAAFRPHTWMPSFFNQSNNTDDAERTDQEIHAMVHFLTKNSEEFPMDPMPVEGDAFQGEKLVASLGCMACHKTADEAGQEKPANVDEMRRSFGPVLTGMGSKTSETWLYHWLKNPQAYHPDTRMPDMRLSDQEAADITRYLISFQDDGPMASDIPPVQAEVLDTMVLSFLKKAQPEKQAREKLADMTQDDKLLFSGEKLLRHYGCYGCHDIKGFEHDKPIGAALSDVGSKVTHKFEFGYVDLEHTRHAWFDQKLKNPRVFDKSLIKEPYDLLKMPNFHFTQEQVDGVVTALLGFVKQDPHLKVKPRTPENLFIEEGQKLVRQNNCQACHIMEGEGGAILPTVQDWLTKYEGKTKSDADALAASFSAPNLIGEGKKVKTQWLFEFLHQPETIRPWLQVRMPSFHFHEDELNALVKYFSALDGETFPFRSVVDTSLSLKELEAGKQLFSPDVFDCANCHIQGDKFPAGTPDRWAPDLTMARDRLKAEWIIDWIKNPGVLLPGTKMPTYFDEQFFDSAGPDDILDGDENEQIRVLRNYLYHISEREQAASEAARAF